MSSSMKNMWKGFVDSPENYKHKITKSMVHLRSMFGLVLSVSFVGTGTGTLELLGGAITALTVIDGCGQAVTKCSQKTTLHT